MEDKNKPADYTLAMVVKMRDLSKRVTGLKLQITAEAEKTIVGEETIVELTMKRPDFLHPLLLPVFICVGSANQPGLLPDTYYVGRCVIFIGCLQPSSLHFH